MRFPNLKLGLMSALIACAAFTAAGAQEGDKSYLPPQSYQGKAEPPIQGSAKDRSGTYANAGRLPGGVAQPTHRRTRLAHRRRYERYASNQRFFPRFLFGFFN